MIKTEDLDEDIRKGLEEKLDKLTGNKRKGPVESDEPVGSDEPVEKRPRTSGGNKRTRKQKKHSKKQKKHSKNKSKKQKKNKTKKTHGKKH